MAILADHQYNLHKYLDVSHSGAVPELTEEVIGKINKLAQLVGAPTYKKTPVFKHRAHARKRSYPNGNRVTITADDWEAMRNFKTTVLSKPKEGIDTEIESIRSALNKLTATNYEEITETIGNILSRVLTIIGSNRYTITIRVGAFACVSTMFKYRCFFISWCAYQLR